MTTELPEDSSVCGAINPATFGIATKFDADAGGNVTPNMLATWFNAAPSNIPSF